MGFPLATTEAKVGVGDFFSGMVPSEPMETPESRIMTVSMRFIFAVMKSAAMKVGAKMGAWKRSFNEMIPIKTDENYERARIFIAFGVVLPTLDPVLPLKIAMRALAQYATGEIFITPKSNSGLNFGETHNQNKQIDTCF